MNRSLNDKPSKLGQRDAFHVAVVAVRCNIVAVRPGECVKLVDNETAESSGQDDRHGIVNPMLKNWVARGELFWLLLDHDKIENLAHTFDFKLDCPSRLQTEPAKKPTDSLDDYDYHSQWCQEENC